MHTDGLKAAKAVVGPGDRECDSAKPPSEAWLQSWVTENEIVGCCVSMTLSHQEEGRKPQPNWNKEVSLRRLPAGLKVIILCFIPANPY